MLIRQANTNDWQAIQRLNLQIFEFEAGIEPTSNLEFPFLPEAVEYFHKAAEGRDGHVAFVCEDEGRVVGYAIAKLIPAQEVTARVGVKLAQLHTISVDKDYRNKGAGKLLANKCIEWAAAQGANRLKVVSFAGNARARHLYEQCGFSEYEVVYERKL